MNYIPHNSLDVQEMLKQIGVKSINDLFADIPPKMLLKDELLLDREKDELTLTREFKQISDKNITGPIFIGAGAYNHFVPALVDYIISRGEFLTAYTPYQPEISQGTLRAIYDYQSMIAELTGMDIANASMYDGASAAAEAMLMVCNEKKTKKVLVSETLNPFYIDTLKTYASANDIEIIYIPEKNLKTDLDFVENILGAQKPAAIIISSPNFFGEIENHEKLSYILEQSKTLFVSIVTEALSLALLKPAGEFNADVVCGEAQSFGSRINFGGPYLGFFAVTKKFMRKMPGRLVGKTVDKNNTPAYTLTLSTREQHIRREKATSNICSNHNLQAIAACVYLSLLGPELKNLALINYNKAHKVAKEINSLKGYSLVNKGTFFNEFVIRCDSIDETKKALEEQNIAAGYTLAQHYKQYKDCLLFCVTEMNNDDEIDLLINTLKKQGN